MTPIASPGIERPALPSVWVRALHLFTLCGFAITQPLLTALKGQSVYLRDQQIGWLEIGVFLTILTLIGPLSVLALDWIVVWLSRSINGYGRNAVFATLFTLFLLSLLRPYVAFFWLVDKGLTGLFSAGIALAFSWVLVSFYERFIWFRFWLTCASIGIVVFPTMFVLQFRSVRQADALAVKHVEIKSPTPVVLVVFDEFSGTTLMNERMEIDAERFPQFARLAKNSTWYRRMTTVHPRTTVAVPAILSGQYPVSEREPLNTQYPDNLLQLIESSRAFDMAVFEPATRLCPRSLCNIPEPEHSLFQKCSDLILTMSAVYPRLIFSRDFPIEFPVIPKEWFGIHTNTIQKSGRYSNLTEGLFAYSRGLNRDEQLQHFLKCLIDSDRPRFCFLHAMIPHYPWCFLPTGEKYQAESFEAHGPPVAQGELGEHWPLDSVIAIRAEYRYRLQVGYVDRFLGQLLDRLKENGIFDRCLLVVTADHGVAFRPGHSRREPDAENLANILSVPLFIKLPDQASGKIDDRNVESVDVLPTIADVLGMELPESIDGVSVSSDLGRPRKTLYFSNSMLVIEPDFPQLDVAVKRQSLLFGSDPLDRLPESASSHAEWHGQPISKFEIDDQITFFQQLHPLTIDPSIEKGHVSPMANGLVCGNIQSTELRDTSNEIVFAVNGFIHDTSKLARTGSNSYYFEFLGPRFQDSDTAYRTDLYLVVKSQEKTILRRLVAGR